MMPSAVPQLPAPMTAMRFIQLTTLGSRSQQGVRLAHLLNNTDLEP